MGVMLACFQVIGTLPCAKEKSNTSGSAAFPTVSEFKVSLLPVHRFVCIDSSECLFLDNIVLPRVALS